MYKSRWGGQQGAMAWLRDVYVTKWWDQHFPEATGASEEDRAWFFKNSGMGKLLWAYLNNPIRALKTEDGQVQGSSSKKRVMTRAVAHDAYRREHPEEYNEAVEEWVKDNDSQPNLNDRNKLSYGVFSKLSNQDKKLFKDKAIAAVKESRKLARITDPKEREKFMLRFWASLREFLTDVSEMAGIEMCALVVHEMEDGRTWVTRELSAGINAFSSSPALAKSMDALKAFLEERGGPTDIPVALPQVYPDFGKDGHPCLPNFQGWSLRQLRKLLRDYIKALFKFQGGIGRMIWKEIKAALYYWLDPQRLPKVEGLVWDDPEAIFMGKHIQGPTDIPVALPQVYPDFGKDGHPCLPNFQGWSLRQLRKLLRDYIKALFKFQGGIGRIIWKEIKAALYYWLDPQRLPKVEGLVWDDPEYLCKEMVLVWLEFFLACLTGIIPPEKCFQFLCIPAGSAPIHPSESQETSQELVEREGKMVYVLKFGNKINKCHRVGGMSYDQRAIDYARFVAFGSDHINAASAPPIQWLDLPSFGPNIILSVFFGEELEQLTSWVLLLPEVAQARARTVIDVANAYQAHIPAVHPIGIWLHKSELPLVFPRTPNDASRDTVSFWLPLDYFKPAGAAAVAGTMYYFEVCQAEMHDSDLILHKPSSTLYGGITGVVCIMRALVQIYLNCLAIRGDFHPPKEVPPNYDVSRFNVQEHDRITGWIDKWVALIENHTKILSRTSSERKAGLRASTVHASSKDSDGDSSSGSDTEDSKWHACTDAVPPSSPGLPSTSAPAPIPSTVLVRLSKVAKGKRPERARKFTDFHENSEDSVGLSKVAKGKRPERSRKSTNPNESTEDSGNSDVDFEVLDVTSQDEKSSEEEDLSLFNDRFLDDDIFPAGDPIGLRERYDFNPEVKFQFVIGVEPFDGSIIEHLQPPKKDEPLFGGFPELQPYKALRITRPETVIRHLIAVGTQAHRAKHRWQVYNQANPRFMPEMQDVTNAEASVFPSEVRPLIRLMYNRMLSWLRVRAMAPCVFAHWQTMAYILREALSLFATAERFINDDKFLDPEFTAEDLINQVRSAKLQVVELSYISSELRDWYDLARRATKKLEGSWMPQAIPPLGGIVQMMDGIVWWTEQTYELGAAHIEDRPQIWKAISDSPFEPVKKGVNYLFGCATEAELPDEFYDALEAARKQDPSTVVMVEVAIPATTIGTAPSSHGRFSDPTAVIESSTEAPIASTSNSGHNADGDREMDVGPPEPSTSAPPASSEPKRKRPIPKGPSEHSTSPGIDEQSQIVGSAPATEANPLPIEKSSTKSANVPTETRAAEKVRTGDKISKEGAEESIGTPTSSQRHDPTSSSSMTKRKSKDKAEVKAKDPSPSPCPTVPKTRLSRKRKPHPETETEIEATQGKRTSVRLQVKSGGAMVNEDAKQGGNTRRSSARINRK
ncbi:unnamed protein product [Rhizoctonia solani]|uniref:Uncharacterized protein n=1 Tax=Rhizoctonia solani TaxID=456999 RepID=A0A8H3BPG6_9AGAM|nr:unnamed protein product [Rhizoctonia solani]